MPRYRTPHAGPPRQTESRVQIRSRRGRRPALPKPGQARLQRLGVRGSCARSESVTSTAERIRKSRARRVCGISLGLREDWQRRSTARPGRDTVTDAAAEQVTHSCNKSHIRTRIGAGSAGSLQHCPAGRPVPRHSGRPAGLTAAAAQRKRDRDSESRPMITILGSLTRCESRLGRHRD